MSPIEHIIEQIAACIPFVGMTGDVVPPVYMKIVVGVVITAIITLGGGYVAGAVSAARSKVEFEWIKQGLVDAKTERDENRDNISMLGNQLNNFKGEVYKSWGTHK